MIKKFTRKENLHLKKTKQQTPSVQTLDFIKLFARTYYVEKKLPTNLGEVCLN